MITYGGTSPVHYGKSRPGDQSAEAILDVARKQKGQSREALFEIVDDPIGRRHMTEAERLNFLLNYKLAMIVGILKRWTFIWIPRKNMNGNYCRIMMIGCSWRSTGLRQLILCLSDCAIEVQQWLPCYSATLRSQGTSRPPKVVYESDSFYGWEGGWNELGYYHFPVHHCYEEAIKHITGKPINEVIKLTDEQVTQLVQGYRQPKAYDDTSKLYVLFRLEPHIAREEATRKFRNSTKEERFRFCHLMPDLLPKGLLLTEVRRLLGAPDRVREHHGFTTVETVRLTISMF